MISNRLNHILKQVIDYNSVLDVGSDHGQLAIELKKNNPKSIIYASEKNIGPFRNLTSSINESNLDITALNLDGIKLAPVVDAIVIAGMGGELIRSILFDGKEYLNNHKPALIIEPQSKLKECRKALLELKYEIITDFYIEERGHYYPIIKAVFNENIIDKGYHEYGYLALKNKDGVLLKKLNSTLETYQNIKAKENDVMDLKKVLTKFY